MMRDRVRALGWLLGFLFFCAAAPVASGPEESGKPVSGKVSEEQARGLFVAGTSANSLGMEFVRIPEGSFVMGSPRTELGRDEDELQHPVTISMSLYLQTKEVTQSQWEKIMGRNPSQLKGCGANCPVELVTWGDAIEFCNRLSELEGLRAAYRIVENDTIWEREAEGYRLPTEAEWEYACRARTTTPFYTGEITRTSIEKIDPSLDRAGWYFANAIGTSPVGLKEPNGWGLYDMHGNVWEWCWDWYGTSYPTSQVKDPAGPLAGSRRVVRGGSWYGDAKSCRSAERIGYAPTGKNYSLGLRVCRSISIPSWEDR